MSGGRATPFRDVASPSEPRPPAAAQSPEVAAEAAEARARPDVILFLLDQWRADYDGHHPRSAGFALPTFSAIAARGARFTHAVVPSPQCAPSRAALATGLSYLELCALQMGRGRSSHRAAFPAPTERCNVGGVSQALANGAAPTVYELLRRAGYATLTAGKDDLTKDVGVGADGRMPRALGFEGARRCLGKFDAVAVEETTTTADDPPPPALCPYSRALRRAAVAVGGPSAAGAALLARLRAHAAAAGWKPPYPKAPAWSREALLSNESATTAFELLRFSYGTCGKGGACADSFVPAHLYEDNWVTTQARELLALQTARGAASRARGPYFLQVNYLGPHPPYVPPPPPPPEEAERGAVTLSMDDWTWLGRALGRAAGAEDAARRAAEAHRRNYVTMIQNIDAGAGALLSDVVLAERGVSSSAGGRAEEASATAMTPEASLRAISRTTLVCMTSDHGDFLGARGLWGKRRVRHAAAAVPLACAGPGVVARRVVVSAPVEVRDLFASFLVLANATAAPHMTIAPLAAVAGRAAPREVVFSALEHGALALASVPSGDRDAADADAADAEVADFSGSGSARLGAVLYAHDEDDEPPYCVLALLPADAGPPLVELNLTNCDEIEVQWGGIGALSANLRARATSAFGARASCVAEALVGALSDYRAQAVASSLPTRTPRC